MIDTLLSGDDDDNEAVVSSAENFVWEGISNYKGQREQYRGGFGPQSAEKKSSGNS
jgi:hypothetical protein